MILTFPGPRITPAPVEEARMIGRLQALRAYWEGLRGPGGALPRRLDLDPRGFGSALDALFIAESLVQPEAPATDPDTAPGLAEPARAYLPEGEITAMDPLTQEVIASGRGLLRLRVAGSALNALSGMEMRGLPLSMLFRPEARAPLARAVAGMLASPAVVTLAVEAGAPSGRGAQCGRMLMLPLTDSLGLTRLVLGFLPMTGVAGSAGRGPGRLAIAGIEVEPLSVPESPLLTRPARAPQSRPAPVEPLTPMNEALPGGAAPTKSARPALRLVE